MAQKKCIQTERDGFRFHWTNGDGETLVTAYKLNDKSECGDPVMEWAYPNLKRGLAANVELWEEQAAMQARSEARG